MKFRLTYDGALPSLNQRKSWKPIQWEIRKQISDQLVQLYQVHPVLSEDPKIAMWSLEPTHPLAQKKETMKEIFREPIEVAGHKCIPLVRKSLLLSCALDVLFMRRQKAGELITGGDIDNRMQLLFDALQMPGQSDIASGMPETVPPHYLLEDDALITGISVHTDRLLAGPSADSNHAVLLIDVTVSVMQMNSWNMGFLAD